ncbi:2-hydroxyacyl-CoA dehydratase subunit D [Thermodesulfobacteriota bacterium]
MVFTEFEKRVENRHQAAQEWKEKNQKPIVGYFCCVTPEEIISAADILPVKITGSSDVPDKAEEHVPRYACGFLRSLLHENKKGTYDYMDMFAVANTCDLMAKWEYWWRQSNPRPYNLIGGLDNSPHVVYIPYPEVVTGKKVEYYTEMHYRTFKQHIERLAHKEITDDMLSQAIEVYNKHYDLMDELDELRAQDPPLVTGYEAATAELASIFMPKVEHNELMKEYLEEVRNRTDKPEAGVRIFLSSSAVDQESIQLYKIIEECGGHVVCEDISAGSSHFTGVRLDTNKPPMAAIVERTLATPCPRNTVRGTMSSPWPEYRWDYVNKCVSGQNVQGVIFYTLGYCECRALDNPHLKDKFRDELGIPSLFLDGDYTAETLEETRSRIQAFIEMIGD